MGWPGIIPDLLSVFPALNLSVPHGSEVLKKSKKRKFPDFEVIGAGHFPEAKRDFLGHTGIDGLRDAYQPTAKLTGQRERWYGTFMMLGSLSATGDY